MIYLQMSGRLGNQFFRYAAARALQLKYYPNEEIVINYQQKINGDESFFNALSDFQVAPFSEYKEDRKVLLAETDIIQKIICIIYLAGMRKIPPEDMNRQTEYERKWEKILNKMGVYWFRRGGWELKYTKRKNKFLSGNFENLIYFDEIRDILLKEFTPKNPIIPKNEIMYKQIKNTASVCISVRRGDFETNEKFKSLHSVCNENYFTRAIKLIKNKIENPVFYMFSDDIEWVKENIDTGCETYYEDGTDPVWEKMRLMSACKHFIISNSTFSWWAQYLGNYENKIVVSPDKWFNNDYESPLIDKNWILIKSKLE